MSVITPGPRCSQPIPNPRQLALPLPRLPWGLWLPTYSTQPRGASASLPFPSPDSGVRALDEPGEVRQVTNSRTKRNRDARPSSISARRVLTPRRPPEPDDQPVSQWLSLPSPASPVIPRDTAVVGVGARPAEAGREGGSASLPASPPSQIDSGVNTVATT